MIVGTCCRLAWEASATRRVPPSHDEVFTWRSFNTMGVALVTWWSRQKEETVLDSACACSTSKKPSGDRMCSSPTDVVHYQNEEQRYWLKPSMWSTTLVLLASPLWIEYRQQMLRRRSRRSETGLLVVFMKLVREVIPWQHIQNYVFPNFHFLNNFVKSCLCTFGVQFDLS